MRPLDHLTTAAKLYPQAWKQVETMLHGKGKDLPDWPSWCFLPIAGWYSIVSADAKVDRITDLRLIADVSRLAAIGAWRYSQGIYRFDPELQKTLTTTELKGDLPADVLLRLPEWSLYIETPDSDWLGAKMHGFWAHLESDANTGRKELRLLLDTDEALIPFPVHIGTWSIEEAVTRMENEAANQSALQMKKPLLRDISTDKNLVKQLHPLISMVLYLCSDEPEIGNDSEPGIHPQRPTAKKTKQGLRWFPPDRPKIWNIGKEIGNQIRRGGVTPPFNGTPGTPGTHTTRPHIRRAHWHGFWSGPLEGERKFNYKWLPPMFVGGTLNPTS